jgi:uncharacterized protein (TIGR02145 family)
MKSQFILFLLIIPFVKLFSQSYEISFGGTGAATAVDSVIVENLKQGSTLIIGGNENVHLNLPTDISKTSDGISSLLIYPNPMTDNADIQFPVYEGGPVLVMISDASGRTVLQSIWRLTPGLHTCRVTGLKTGLYLIRIQEQSTSHAAKLICQNPFGSEAAIALISSYQGKPATNSARQIKSTASAIEMPYETGERLKLTGLSGHYSTVLTVVPTADTAITFDFMECMDADSNYYSVVTIGTQNWMAENLKTTHYSDGNPIPGITSENNWSALSSKGPAYCWYNNDSTTYAHTYGALYNWPAAMNSAPSSTANPSGVQGICPTGWHLPSDTEWKVLTDYLGGMSVAGGKLKETGKTHWASPNTGATNESGFTALPGGACDQNGQFIYFSEYTAWWTATEYNTNNSWGRGVYNLDKTVYRMDNGGSKRIGISIRCIKD